MKHAIKTFVAAGLMAFGLTITAYAASEISSVTLDICPDTSMLEPGDMADAVWPQVTSGSAEIYDCTIEGGTRQKGVSYYYDIEIVPKSGYVFKKDVQIKVNGGSKVSVKSATEDGVKFRVTTYPVFRLSNVDNIEDTGDGYKWDKVSYAKKYNVTVYYEDDDGNDKTTSKTVTDRKINLESIYDKYDIDHISVQAAPGTGETQDFICASEWVMDSGDLDYDKDNSAKKPSYPSATDKKTKSTSTTHNNYKSESSAGYDDGKPGWVRSPNGTWFREVDGSWPANQWKYIEKKWYFFDQNGYMVSGWLNWNGNWYYLKDGVMQSKCWIDGFWLDENGVWVKDPQTK